MDSEDGGVNHDAQTQTAIAQEAALCEADDTAAAAAGVNRDEDIANEPAAESQAFITPDGVITTQAILSQEDAATGVDTSAFIINMVDGNPVLTTTDLAASNSNALLQGQGIIGLGEGGMQNVIQGNMNLTTATIDGQQVFIVTDNSALATNGADLIQLNPDVQQEEPETIVKQEQVGEVEEEEQEDGTEEPASKRIKLIQQFSGKGELPTYILTLSQPGVSLPEAGTDTATADNVEDQSDILQEQADELEEDKDAGDGTVISQAWFTTRDDKTQLQSKGHSWRMGQWAKEEVELLQQNIISYCQERNIQDPTEIIFEMSKDERKDFYRSIARGLNRPLFSVYRRVIRMYDQRNYIGKYSPGELTKLKELREKHGADWATIGAILGRSASSVKDRCRLMRGSCNSGKWLPEEEKKLTEAVYELSGAQPGESITSGLSWSVVAERVMTRTEKQCRTKWLNYLNWKQKGGTEWTREDDILLINKIAASGAIDETQLDWTLLAQDWPSARSPQWLRGKWWSLKRHVPQYTVLSFTDIVSYIQRMNAANLHLGTTRSPIGSVKMSQLNLDRVNVLAIPIGADGTTQAIAPTNLKLEEDAGNSEVSYGVLQQNMVSTSTPGAFLITQPQNNPAFSFSPSTGAGTDHIIVHTLPLSQVSQGLKQHENLAVQLDPNSAQPTIISNIPDHIAVQPVDGAVHSIDAAGSENAVVVTLPLETNITQVEPDPSQAELESQADLACVTEGDDGATTRVIIAPSNSVEDEDHHQSLIAQQIGGEEMSAVGIEQAELEGVDVGQDIVSSASTQFVQAEGNEEDLIHMSSLSDPLLISGSADLAGPYSDIEAVKSQTVAEGDEQVDSPTS